MKIIQSFLMLAIAFFYVETAVAQNQWITDNEMQFKINAPSNYSQKQFQEGSDKVLTLMSSDQNVMIRVRAMPATEQFTPEALQRAFEQNMIQGASRIMNENGNLHGIPAVASAYTWKVDKDEAVLGAYYIVKNGFAYIVWTAIPRNLIQQRSAEADKIINSFELLQPEATSTGGGLLSGLGNIGNSTTSNSANSTPPPPPPAPKSSNPDYLEMVSDDACIEHYYPKNYKRTSSELGQSIWEDGSGIKMVVQTILKQGSFRDYAENNIQSIKNQGADVVKKQYTTVNGLQVLQYFYTYSDTYFAYFAVENNDVYYLLGFVGSNLKQSKIVGYANEVVQSVKIAPCSGSY